MSSPPPPTPTQRCWLGEGCTHACLVMSLAGLMSQGKHVSYMVLDFRMVEEVDTTAVKKIKKLMRYTDKVGLTIVMTNLTKAMRENFDEEGVCELKQVSEKKRETSTPPLTHVAVATPNRHNPRRQNHRPAPRRRCARALHMLLRGRVKIMGLLIRRTG
jgi:anti-anti-sigma regulatory factor